MFPLFRLELYMLQMRRAANARDKQLLELILDRGYSHGAAIKPWSSVSSSATKQSCRRQMPRWVPQ
jgi:hypothetical protein